MGYRWRKGKNAQQPDAEPSAPQATPTPDAPLDPYAAAAPRTPDAPVGSAPAAGTHRADASGDAPAPTPQEDAEMSPIIYRPAGRTPDDEPRPDPFAERTPGAETAPEPEPKPAAEPAHEPDEAAAQEGLDDDPDISEDELTGEAEDVLLDDVDEAIGHEDFSSEPPAPSLSEDSLAPEPVSPDPVNPDPVSSGPEVVPEVLPAPGSVAPAAAPEQSRYRRIFDEDDAAETPDEPTLDPEPAPSQPDPKPDVVADPAVSDVPDPADTTAGREDGQPAVRRRRIGSLHISAPPTGLAPEEDFAPEPVEASEIPDPQLPDPIPSPAPSDDDLPDSEIPDPQLDDATTHAVRGHVVSTRGRGLSGVTVTVLDADDLTVATTTTGRRGSYSFASLAPGTYRIVATDAIDGDFEDGDHPTFTVETGNPLPDLDIRQIGRVAIDASLDSSSSGVGGAEVSGAEITVLDRSTGMPAKGSVLVTTQTFGTELRLRGGRARLTLLSPGTEGHRLRIEYSGSKHNGPARRTMRLP